MAFCQKCGTAVADGVAQCDACSNASGPVLAAQPTSAGLTTNVAGALAYFAGFITGILFLVLDPYKQDRFVRFHAFQSIFFNVAWAALWIAWIIVGLLLGAVTKGLFFLIQIPVDLLLMLGGLCLWLFLMYSAYKGKTFKLPIIGEIAAKQAGL
ncbi:MAG: hypothetical protein ABI064_04570 [Acidobacteriaceae bacterium]